jgi:hypothetical protein
MRGIENNIKESTTTEGTIALVLDGASTQFFSVGSRFADGDVVFYSVAHDNPLLDEAEGGMGTYDVATDSISRDVVFWSTNSDALVNFSAGSKTVICTAPAEAFSPPRPVCDFRLSLTSGTPVTVSDVATATTLYAAMYKGNQISLYANSRWQVALSGEMSLALGTLVANKNYDVFCYLNAGVPALELGAAWTNDTTRATALDYQDGVLVKFGDATRRYLGTFRTISTTETCDTERRRLVWNYYNRVNRKLKVVDAADTWNFSTASFQQANANAANQVEVLLGLAEDYINLFVSGRVTSSTSTFRTVSVAIGVNSTSVGSFDTSTGASVNNTINANPEAQLASCILGFTIYAWLERGAGGDTQSWRGDSGTTYLQAGLFGMMVG